MWALCDFFAKRRGLASLCFPPSKGTLQPLPWWASCCASLFARRLAGCEGASGRWPARRPVGSGEELRLNPRMVLATSSHRELRHRAGAAGWKSSLQVLGPNVCKHRVRRGKRWQVSTMKKTAALTNEKWLVPVKSQCQGLFSISSSALVCRKQALKKNKKKRRRRRRRRKRRRRRT